MSPSKLRDQDREEIRERLRAGVRPVVIHKETGVGYNVILRLRDKAGIAPVPVAILNKLQRSGYRKGDLAFLDEMTAEFFDWLIARHHRVTTLSDMIYSELYQLYREEMQWLNNPPVFVSCRGTNP